VEAMFCGTPVIAYHKGSMPELINDKVSGFLVNNKQEAIEAVGAVTKINRTQCYEYATAKFSYDVMVDKYVEAYRTILNG